MKYALIIDDIVEQIQPNFEEGFVEVPNNTITGMVDNGDGTFSIPNKTQFELIKLKIQSIKTETDTNASVAIDTVVYNGGNNSAASISDGVNLAKSNGYETIGIWDINDETTVMSIIDAETIAKTIGNQYAAIMYARQARITLARAVDFPTIEETQAALDLI